MAKKNIKDELASRLAENSKRHFEAKQNVDFDAGKEHLKLLIESIDPNPYQPRTIFPSEELEALATSIAETGLLQPVTVRRAGQRFQLIAGERRLRACKLLGRPTIEALVTDCDDSGLAVLALAENIDREDLSDYEIGKALRQIENLFPSKKKLAESLGLNREDMYKYFAFEALPEFIRGRLNENPRLLSRSAAVELRRVIQEKGGHPSLSAFLSEAWTLLEAGNLEQTKLPSYLNRMFKEPVNVLKSDEWSLDKDGKIVCSLFKKGRNLSLQLDGVFFDLRKQKLLHEFLQSLL